MPAVLEAPATTDPAVAEGQSFTHEGVDYVALRRVTMDPSGTSGAPYEPNRGTVDDRGQYAGYGLAGAPTAVPARLVERFLHLTSKFKKKMSAEERREERELHLQTIPLLPIGPDYDVSKWVPEERHAEAMEQAKKMALEWQSLQLSRGIGCTVSKSKNGYHVDHQYGGYKSKDVHREHLHGCVADAALLGHATDKDARAAAKAGSPEKYLVFMDLAVTNHYLGSRGRLWRPRGGVLKKHAGYKTDISCREAGGWMAQPEAIRTVALESLKREENSKAPRKHRPPLEGLPTEYRHVDELLKSSRLNTPGNRHYPRLEMSGTLLKIGVPDAAVEAILAYSLGDATDAAGAVSSTRDAMNAHGPNFVSGASALRKRMGNEFMARLAVALALDTSRSLYEIASRLMYANPDNLSVYDFLQVILKDSALNDDLRDAWKPHLSGMDSAAGCAKFHSKRHCSDHGYSERATHICRCGFCLRCAILRTKIDEEAILRDWSKHEHLIRLSGDDCDSWEEARQASSVPRNHAVPLFGRWFCSPSGGSKWSWSFIGADSDQAVWAFDRVSVDYERLSPREAATHALGHRLIRAAVFADLIEANDRAQLLPYLDQQKGHRLTDGTTRGKQELPWPVARPDRVDRDDDEGDVVRETDRHPDCGERCEILKKVAFHAFENRTGTLISQGRFRPSITEGVRALKAAGLFDPRACLQQAAAEGLSSSS